MNTTLIVVALIALWLLLKYRQLYIFRHTLNTLVRSRVENKTYRDGRLVNVAATYNRVWESFNPFTTKFDIIYE